MKKVMFVAALALFSAPSFAKVDKLIIQNDSNRNITCAVAVYEPPPSNKWIVYSWYNLNNGGVMNHYNVSFYRCEEQGNTGVFWGTQRNFCVGRGNTWVSPLHKADDFNMCSQTGREWQGFNQLPNQTNYTLYINP